MIRKAIINDNEQDTFKDLETESGMLNGNMMEKPDYNSNDSRVSIL